MKSFIRWIVIIIIIAAAIPLWVYRNSIRTQTQIEGYVVKADGQPAQPLTLNTVSLPALYEYAVKTPPMMGTAVSVKSKQLEAATDTFGYFSINCPLWFFEKQKILLSISDKNSSVNIPLVLTERKPMFLVVRKMPSGTEVFLRESIENERRMPVVLATMNLFFKPDTSEWAPFLGLAKHEGLDNKFLFFQAIIETAGDIRETLDQLNRKLMVVNRITGGKSLTAIGYSSAALVLRYYTVSDIYPHGMINSLLQIAPPNHGLYLPDFLVKTFGGKKKALYEQFQTDSRFLKLINKEIPVSAADASEFRLKTVYMNETGFNASVKAEIIAGEVMKEKIDSLKSIGETISGSIDEAVKYWADVLKKAGVDTEALKSMFGSTEGSPEPPKTTDENVPKGDLVVSLKSASASGVPQTVLPYNHFDLLKAEGLNDPRYKTIRDFLTKNLTK